MKSVFLLKHTLRFFIFKFEIKCEALLLYFFKKKPWSTEKTLYRKNMKKLLTYMLYTDDATGNLYRWNNGGNDIYKKDQ